ncbi:MAG: acetyl-CoA carboxylase biotin carboxyl carrier protein subunit [Bacteroidales bacterium]
MMQNTKKGIEKKREKKPLAVTNKFVVEFRKYTTELNQKFLDRKPYVPKDESKITSFIPGTIAKIYVSEGQRIEVGQPLMMLEAMKMKNTVFAERAGFVRRINAIKGDHVPKSKVIFELDLD